MILQATEGIIQKKYLFKAVLKRFQSFDKSLMTDGK
jgi:hypothetical protein